MLIDRKIFHDFLSDYSGMIMGETKNHVPATLLDELGEVGRMVTRAYASGFSCTEKSDGSSMYKNAAKKLLYLNSKSKELCGSGFIKEKIDKESREETKALVDELMCILMDRTV